MGRSHGAAAREFEISNLDFGATSFVGLTLKARTTDPSSGI